MRILGTSEDTGKLLGLDKEWLVRAIKAVGNYGEIFERNVGPKLAAEPAARPQQPVEQGRPHVRAAGPLARTAGAVRGHRERAWLAFPLTPVPSLPRERGVVSGAARRAALWTAVSQALPGRAPRKGATGPGAARPFAAWSTRLVALAAGRLRRLVPRPQHAGQHAGARHPERLRLPPPARRLRHRRDADPLRRARPVLEGVPRSACSTRCAWRSSASCWPPSSARCSASAASRATRSCAACATPTSSCSATCRCCCSC